MNQDNQIIGFTKWIFKWVAIVAFGLIVLVVFVWGAVSGYEHFTYEIPKQQIKITADVKPRDRILNEQSGDKSSWRSRAVPIGEDGKIKTSDDGKKGVGELCDDPFPIFVGFVNNSKKTVEYIDFNITAKQHERSTNVADYENYSSDKILKPGDGWGNCWRAKLKKEYENLDLRDLEYEVKINYVRFQE